ncbi:MAG: hypothetical protein KDD38_11600 [Bdellovibrionales bacterium]|nr:hypothetical protein [Bdellovibrionales bacterium]
MTQSIEKSKNLAMPLTLAALAFATIWFSIQSVPLSVEVSVEPVSIADNEHSQIFWRLPGNPDFSEDRSDHFQYKLTDNLIVHTVPPNATDIRIDLLSGVGSIKLKSICIRQFTFNLHCYQGETLSTWIDIFDTQLDNTETSSILMTTAEDPRITYHLPDELSQNLLLLRLSCSLAGSALLFLLVWLFRYRCGKLKTKN